MKHSCRHKSYDLQYHPLLHVATYRAGMVIGTGKRNEKTNRARKREKEIEKVIARLTSGSTPGPDGRRSPQHSYRLRFALATIISAKYVTRRSSNSMHATDRNTNNLINMFRR